MPDDDDTRDGGTAPGGGTQDGGTQDGGTQDGGGGSGDDTGGAGPPAAGDSGGGGADGGYVPPSEAEWHRVQEALAAANKEAKNHRLAAKKLRDDQAAAAKAGETEHQAELREAREKAAAEVESRYKPVVVRAAARMELVKAGANITDAAGKVSESRLDRMLKLFDLGELDVGDGGEVSGLGDQIEQIKKDYPEFFTKPAPRARATADAADRPPEPKKHKTSADRLAATLPGYSGG